MVLKMFTPKRSINSGCYDQKTCINFDQILDKIKHEIVG